MIEKERKFLVDKTSLPNWNLSNGKRIKQFYFEHKNGAHLRFRISDSESELTIKGKRVGDERLEIEESISSNFLQEVLKHFKFPIIEKTRIVHFEFDCKWEIDFFHGIHEGLIIAEIELTNNNQKINYPEWISQEITDQEQYYNESLYKKLLY